MSSLCQCLCLKGEEADQVEGLAPIGDVKVAKFSPKEERIQRGGSVAEEQSSSEEEAESDEEEDEIIEKGTYDTLIELAKSVWLTASSYLLPEEQDEYNQQQLDNLKRMNTLELREAVVVGKNLKAAEDQEDQEAVAEVQRESLRLADGKLKFDGDVFSGILLSSLDQETGLVNADKFVQACNAVPLLLGGLGRAFGFASADLIKKIATADQRMRETANDMGIADDEVTLQDMVERDIRNKMTHAGKKAAGAARTILRLMWFLDFIAALLDSVAKKQDQDLKSICSQVYEDTLAPRHAWVLRKVARSGMGMLPPKKVFRQRLGTMDKTPQQEAEMLTRWAADVDKVAKVMWKYMKGKGLEELP